MKLVVLVCSILISGVSYAKDSSKEKADSCVVRLTGSAFKLSWITDQKRAQVLLEEIKKNPDEYTQAIPHLLNNPNLTFKFKYHEALSFASQTKSSISELLPLFTKLLNSNNPEDRILGYSALGSHSQLPKEIVSRIPWEFTTGDSRMILTMWRLIGKLEKIEDPELIQALRQFYMRDFPGFHPKNAIWSREAPEHVNDYNQRLENRMELFRFQASAIHMLLKKSSLDKEIIFNDCKKLIFTEGMRQYSALELLIENGLLSADLIAGLAKKLNNFSNKEFSGLITTAASLIIKHAETHPELDLLIVELMQHPEIRFRSSLLNVLTDRKRPLHPSALKRLQAIEPDMTGQTSKIAQRLIDISRPQAIKENRELTIRKLWRGILGDSVSDALTFPGVSDEQKVKLRALMAENGEVRTTKDTLDYLRTFSWGKPQLYAVPLSGDRQWQDLETPNWNRVSPYDHSMPDIDPYLQDRIGKNLIALAKDSSLDVHVMAATEEEILGREDISLNQFKKIPNPYSTWDIDRYLDLSTARPRVIIRIQPNVHLAKHYQAMFIQAGVTNLKVSVSNASRAQLQNDFRSATMKLLAKMGNQSQVLVFGYEYLWRKMFETTPGWTLHSYDKQEAVHGMAHVRAQKLIISYKTDPSVKREILVVGSDRTLWGEATTYLARAMSEALPQMGDLTFLGSAGSLGFGQSINSLVTRERETNLVYGISVPWTYSDEEGNMFISNPLNWEHSCTHPVVSKKKVGPQQNEIDVALCTNHGFSNSPAEQTLDFTTEQVKNEISTLDVETSHVARFVKEWNDSHTSQKIIFNVVHLITDNPACRQLVWDTCSSLTKVDADRKQQIRENLLHYVLDKWSPRFTLNFKNVNGMFGHDGLSWAPKEKKP